LLLKRYRKWKKQESFHNTTDTEEKSNSIDTTP